jgi:hypothetical protein
LTFDGQHGVIFHEISIFNIHILYSISFSPVPDFPREKVKL